MLGREAELGSAGSALSIPPCNNSPRFSAGIPVGLLEQLSQFILAELGSQLRVRGGVCFICMLLEGVGWGRHRLGLQEGFPGQPVQGLKRQQVDLGFHSNMSQD